MHTVVADSTPQVRTDTVLHALARALDRAPDTPFLSFESIQYSFREVDELSTRFAHSLAELGVDRGQTVATLLDNSIDQIVSWFAINKLGAIWVPLNTAYRGDFLEHQLNDSNSTILVCDNQYLPNVARVAGNLPHLQRILCRGEYSDSSVGDVPIDLLDRYRGTDTSPIPITAAPGDLSLLIYTSGTTGPSKGCMVSHNYICHQGQQTNRSVPPLPGEVMYTCLPLFHISAVDTLVSALLAQTCIAIAKKFSLSGFWSEISQSGAANVRLLSSILPLVAQAADTPEMQRCVGQIRAVTGYATPEVVQVWKKRFGVQIFIAQSYGQSEGARLSTTYAGTQEPPPGSCGQIDTDAFDVVILDEDDNIVSDGEIGEIAYRPRKPHVMFEGYWRRPEETLKLWRNLWMHSGDFGKKEGDFLYFVDRKKDYLRSRGENISSFEIERSFMKHPEISEVVVHAISDGISEDCLKVTAVLESNSAMTERDLCLWSLNEVPYFAVPRFIEFRNTLPKTPTGKITKNTLRQEGLTPATWDRETSDVIVRRSRN
ncbi:AMP-binding protein [Rhodococcus wratislaviensis]|uniref:Putative acid--CoA ligase n=1 Tax=Rhodococcus wratislaviensis NBRC 100605 TaxID=1219028 RepID=X0PZ51_RHOWR|nr:AMP-binding protein [Rhodococcus wratislaviensis]GAF43021.1 putative acid--CoA ligase [Rhodococcus wratislaviensis NBRC 100605]